MELRSPNLWYGMLGGFWTCLWSGNVIPEISLEMFLRQYMSCHTYVLFILVEKILVRSTLNTRAQSSFLNVDLLNMRSQSSDKFHSGLNCLKSTEKVKHKTNLRALPVFTGICTAWRGLWKLRWSVYNDGVHDSTGIGYWASGITWEGGACNRCHHP